MKLATLAKHPCLLVLVFCVAACATQPGSSVKVNPDLPQKRGLIRTIRILPPVVHVKTLSAGGVCEEQEEWSGQAQENVMSAVAQQLKRKPWLRIEHLSAEALTEEAKDNLRETQALFDAIDACILLHSHGPETARFPDAGKAFDHSLGEEVNALAGQAHALLILAADDEISTGGRRTLQAAGMIVGALTGIVVIPTGGRTLIRAALVDAESGSLLWYNWISSGGGYDLRDAESAKRLLEQLLADFPLKAPPS